MRRLPPSQYATGYVLCLVGRAHAEMVDYAEAGGGGVSFGGALGTLHRRLSTTLE
jgi:hypothetical protein